MPFKGGADDDDASMPTRLEIESVGERQRTGAICTQQDSLPTCNEKTMFRMRLCIARSSHFYRAKFILTFSSISEQFDSQNPAMMLGLF
jgi:hypothetical protein